MTIEEIKKMTKEEIQRQLEWSDEYEFGTTYAKYLLKEKKELIDYLKEKTAECDWYISKLNRNIKELAFGGKIAGRTYLANTIMKYTISKQCYQEILSKIEKE